jgi:hypothetical protein
MPGSGVFWMNVSNVKVVVFRVDWIMGRNVGA